MRSTLRGQSKGWASSSVISDGVMLRESVSKPEHIYSDCALYSFSTSSHQQLKKFLSQKCHLGYDI